MEVANTPIRRAVTGGVLIHLPDENNSKKADSLLTVLKAVFKDEESLRIYKPIRMAELQISGLDYSITAGELKEEIANQVCSLEDISSFN